MIANVFNDPSLRYPARGEWFSPSEQYPEYKHGHLAQQPNKVYAAVREMFHQAGYDAANYGSCSWNPLSDFIAPGETVFVLCNFVYHRLPGESEEEFFAKCVHGSVLRVLVDYVLLAVGDQGRVLFGNSPLQSCDWEMVQEETGAADVVRFFSQRNLPVEPRDLRLRVIKRAGLGHVVNQDLRDPATTKIVELGTDSLLHELGERSAEAFRITDYSPREIQAYHSAGQHRYVISRDVLNADTVLSLSKWKTHEKVGITCGLKGFVGIVGHKDCLAHHRFGPPSGGGDEYRRGARILRARSAFEDWLQARSKDAWGQAAFEVADRVATKVLRTAGVDVAGAWWGNDTAWRMTLDLARIAMYASRDGILQANAQRKHLSFIDGVIAGEGDGPLSPTARSDGTLIFSDDVVVADHVAARCMGWQPARIPLLQHALRPDLGLSPVPRDQARVLVNGRAVMLPDLPQLGDRPFAPAHGWRDSQVLDVTLARRLHNGTRKALSVSRYRRKAQREEE